MNKQEEAKLEIQKQKKTKFYFDVRYQTKVKPNYYKIHYAKEWYTPSVGIGVFLSCPTSEKILIGRRIKTGMYGLPGGWLEFGEEWEDAAARELKEETGLDRSPSSFTHVFTLNCRSTPEENQHNISCIMYNEVAEEEHTEIVNTEPDKCSGWTWVSLKALRKNIHLLFYPLRDFLQMFKHVRKATDLKSLAKFRETVV